MHRSLKMSNNNVAPSNEEWELTPSEWKETKEGFWTKNFLPSWSEMTCKERCIWLLKALFVISVPFLVLWLLVIGVPNAWWSNMRNRQEHDIRQDVQFGSWRVCSKDYTFDMPWATTPYYSHCSDAKLDSCFAEAMPACTNPNLADYEYYANRPGAYKQYQSAWFKCRDKCSTRKWEDHCNAMGCQGSNHRQQCFNVSMVEKGFTPAKVTYKPRSNNHPGFAWTKQDDECKPISDICDNSETLAHCGNLAWSSFFFAILGLFGLVAFVVKFKTIPAFLGALACIFLSWLLVLISWAVFAAELETDVTCKMVDSVAWGCGLGADSWSKCVVTAKGEFGVLVDASYTYGLVVAAWILMSLLLIAMCLYLPILFKKPPPETSAI